MTGVTQLQDVVYIACGKVPRIVRFNATTHERLRDICMDFSTGDVRDIVACKQTFELYVAEKGIVDSCFSAVIWRVSTHGTMWVREVVSGWNSSKPFLLSVTKTGILVTSEKYLRQLDTVSDETQRIVDLPSYMVAHHAVESPTGTFIVSHVNLPLKQDQISEVNTECQVLRQFSSSHSCLERIAIDLQGKIFVADPGGHRILLLNGQLALRRVVIDERQLNNRKLQHLCYVEESGQLLVGLDFHGHVAVFDVVCRLHR